MKIIKLIKLIYKYGIDNSIRYIDNYEYTECLLQDVSSDIEELINDPDSIASSAIRVKYKMSKQMDMILWGGITDSCTNTFNGFWDKAKSINNDNNKG